MSWAIILGRAVVACFFVFAFVVLGLVLVLGALPYAIKKWWPS